MARKYDLISELYDRTCKTVVSSPQNWEAFLTSPAETISFASMNSFWCSFSDRTLPQFLKLSVGTVLSVDGLIEVRRALRSLTMQAEAASVLSIKEGVDLIPSNSDLFDFEISLVTAMNREAILRN